MLEAALDML